jgi:homocysteine S-methyltransferase
MPTLAERFASGDVVLLDGATGTELERRGFALEAAGWSARAIEAAPDLLRSIHADYVDAGAEIITANTFRLHPRNLASWGREDDAENLVKRAVNLAREAAANRALVAASMAPIGDCYSPEQVPSSTDLEAEHTELAVLLANAGVDVILVETMVSSREAVAAAKAAAGTGCPFVVSFVCGPEARLLSGTSLAEAVAQIRPLNPAAVCVNCLSVSHVAAALEALQSACGQRPIGVYANTGERGSDGVWRVTNAAEPAVYAVSAQSWKRFGARLIGGCCGTTPDHIRAMKLAWQS